MQTGHPFISSKRAALALVFASLLAIAGCSDMAARLGEPTPALDSLKASITEGADQVSTAANMGWDNMKSAASDIKDRFTLKPTVQVAGTPDIKTVKVSPAADTETVQRGGDRVSYWCESLRQRAAADSTILRSPTLGGSVDARGHGELTVGLNYSSFRKATLGEERAAAECRKFMAETALQKLVFTSPQNLTAAGFRSKADAIDGLRVELARLRQNIKSSLNAGNITHEKASAMFMLIDQLVAEGKSARSQADRRFDERVYSSKAAEQLSTDLRQAQYDLDEIDSARRTADNMNVGVQAGYNHYIGDPPLWAATESQGFNGKVTFTMQLGAVDPRRFEHERRATQAAQDAITNEEQSPIWQIGLMRRSHERAISGLEQSKAEIEKATSEAKHLMAIMADVSQPEFDGAKLNARFQIMKLKAERAAVVGSIIEIRKNLTRLKDG